MWLVTVAVEEARGEGLRLAGSTLLKVSHALPRPPLRCRRIDLVFGCKQRGEAALEAHNVFRHTAYEGAVDIDGVADRTERIALETQVGGGGGCGRAGGCLGEGRWWVRRDGEGG